jgi:hypothetical protein
MPRNAISSQSTRSLAPEACDQRIAGPRAAVILTARQAPLVDRDGRRDHLLSWESRWPALGRDTGRFVGFVQTLAVVASPWANPEAVWDRHGVRLRVWFRPGCHRGTCAGDVW